MKKMDMSYIPSSLKKRVFLFLWKGGISKLIMISLSVTAPPQARSARASLFWQER